MKSIALVTETTRVPPQELLRVANALQRQVQRDFRSVWELEATVEPYLTLDDVPLDAWPIMIREDIDVEDAAGIHEDDNGDPFALVQYEPGWSIIASHECLEMLADPLGDRLERALGPKTKRGQKKFETVDYLVEVCDPSEDARFGYEINGELVSDFYFPEYFLERHVAGQRYSFTGAITKPRQVLAGGYISFRDPATQVWWQVTRFGPTKLVKLGKFSKSRKQPMSLRSWTDRRTPVPPFKLPKNLRPLEPRPFTRLTASNAADPPPLNVDRASALRRQVSGIIKGARRSGGRG